MARPVRFHPLFESDLRDAAEWYDDRRRGLGEAFMALVWNRIDDVVGDPETGSVAEEGIRVARVRRFPYVILYSPKSSVLLILGVLHTARSREKWLRSRTLES